MLKKMVKAVGRKGFTQRRREGSESSRDGGGTTIAGKKERAGAFIATLHIDRKGRLRKLR